MQARSAANFIVATAAVAALLACAAKVDSAGIPPAQTVVVDVTPDSAALVQGQAAQFAAAVTGSADVAVTWQIDEVNGGNVTQGGLYTAPGATGTFHVRAVSRADPVVSAVATVTVTAPPVGSVTISPKTISLVIRGTTTFRATVANLGSSAVTWSVRESSGCGSVSTGGVYTAPSAVATCHVVATSVADPTKSDVATVTVTAPPTVTVAIAPTTATVDACTTYTFRATVTGTQDSAVTWSVSEGSTGGTVSSAGVYSAPDTAGTYHVVAASRASPAATASATVTVRDHVLSITVDPSGVSVSPGGAQQFTASVTTSCGTFIATSQ